MLKQIQHPGKILLHLAAKSPLVLAALGLCCLQPLWISVIVDFEKKGSLNPQNASFASNSAFLEIFLCSLQVD